MIQSVYRFRRYVNPSLDPINASNYHFPKKTPPRERICAPKWEQDRYRDYKHRPGTPMRHVLKPPSAPKGVNIFWQVPNGMDFAFRATLRWSPPASTGQSNITHYLLSVDGGLTWTEVKGGGDVTEAELKGLKRGQVVSAWIRAVNVVGAGPWQQTSGTNRARFSAKELRKFQSVAPEDRPEPTAKPRMRPLRQAADTAV